MCFCLTCASARLFLQHEGSLRQKQERRNWVVCIHRTMQLLLCSCLTNGFLNPPNYLLNRHRHTSIHRTPGKEQKHSLHFPSQAFREKTSFSYLELLNFIISAVVLDTLVLPWSLHIAVRVNWVIHHTISFWLKQTTVILIRCFISRVLHLYRLASSRHSLYF